MPAKKQNMDEIKANQDLLHEVINQVQSFAVRSDEETASQQNDLAALRADMESLRHTFHVQSPHGVAPSNTSPTMAVADEELYTDWDVVGQIPPHIPNFANSELESRISTCLKQRETPMYDGNNDDDIDVYVLNMISWYAAYGLYLAQAQIGWRVGELMLNHTKVNQRSGYFKTTKANVAGRIRIFFMKLLTRFSHSQ
ncbi:hypothetical protein PHMEG_00010099 [Phytophthora megakarya]|uniref:Uncharacterized protein n=1 Tax=Phytophthora megakarya TaxID=4795 RepID=A0A225WEW1_9STRA|nr:hypothetical protein PHMEG_00010099 [Phytophthora megakarya]